MFLPTRFLKAVHWTLAVALTLQPVLMAVPIPVAQAAPAKTSDQAAVGPVYPSASRAAAPALYPAPAASTVAPSQISNAQEALRTAPIMFIESEAQPGVSAQGKERPKKTFQVQGANGNIWLAPDAMWVTLLEPPAEETIEERLMRGPERMKALEARTNELVEAVNLKISFEGANPDPHIEGFDPLDTTVSYFIGSDPDKWRADVPVWGGVRYANLYPGIDLVVSSKDGAWDWKLEVKEETSLDPLSSYLFGMDTAQVASEPSPLEDVRLRVEGAEGLDVLSSGKFALQPAVGITTNVGDYALPLLDVVGAEPDPAAEANVAGEVVEAPFAEAPAPKVMAGPQMAIADDLVYSTFLGGYGYDNFPSIAVDASGAAYVTLATDAEDYPATSGAYQTPADSFDVYVVKISAGGGRVYIARIGGQGIDLSFDIAVDTFGAAYVVGMTSFDFPPVNPFNLAGMRLSGMGLSPSWPQVGMHWCTRLAWVVVVMMPFMVWA